MSNKIKNLGKEALYTAGKILSNLTPVVPGDLQENIAEHYRDKLKPSEYFIKETRTSGDYTHLSSIIQVVPIGFPLFVAGTLGIINDADTGVIKGENIGMFASGLYFICDGVGRYVGAKLFDRPSATVAIEVPYRLGKIVYENVKEVFE